MKKWLWIIIGIVIVVLAFGIVKKPKVSEPLSCGNNICEEGETNRNCAKDCCRDFYLSFEKTCIEKGWKKIIVEVNGIPRKLLWKEPEQWKFGAIILLHGGGGAASNYCGDLKANEPMEAFSELAVKEGFAIFALDSAYNLATDFEGRPIGKRWDSIQSDRENVDLPFIEKVIDDTIPSMRKEGSSNSIFITGISNGGFMTILAGTYFADKINAFAPISAGDPYGTYFDMGTNSPGIERQCAPGVWRDTETNKEIYQEDACIGNYSHEKTWPVGTEEKPYFKQFHHEGDLGVNIACMKKANNLLVQHGYKDDEAFIITDTDGKSILDHFWHEQYNKPLIEFFEKHSLK